MKFRYKKLFFKKEHIMIEQLLKESNALLKGHFLLTSGKHSEFYIEKIKIINNPKFVDKICSQMTDYLKDINCDIVVGPAYGGIVLAYEVAKKLEKKFLFTQRKEGKMTIRSGFEVKPYEKAIIIEDIITTGGSVKEVIDVLRGYLVDIQAISCVVDRSNRSVSFDYDFLPLLTLDIISYDEKECPLCSQGIPITKPGVSDKVLYSNQNFYEN